MSKFYNHLLYSSDILTILQIKNKISLPFTPIDKGQISSLKDYNFYAIIQLQGISDWKEFFHKNCSILLIHKKLFINFKLIEFCLNNCTNNINISIKIDSSLSELDKASFSKKIKTCTNKTKNDIQKV